MLRQVPVSDRTRRSHAYELLARARAELGDLDGARETLTELQSIAADLGMQLMRAAVSVAAGSVRLAEGNADAAQALFEDAIDLYERGRLPYEAAEGRLLLARALMARGQKESGRDEIALATQVFERIGARHALRTANDMLARPAPGPATAAAPLTRREAEILRLVGEGLSDKAIAQRLTISEHTVHPTSPALPSSGPTSPALSSSEPTLPRPNSSVRLNLSRPSSPSRVPERQPHSRRVHWL